LIKKRWFSHVIRDMLALRYGTKTDFMYAGRLNSRQLNRYMSFMVSNGLMEEHRNGGNGARYQVTAHGEEALGKLHNIMELLGMDDEVTS